jgi:hypothetical protein
MSFFTSYLGQLWKFAVEHRALQLTSGACHETGTYTVRSTIEFYDDPTDFS